MSAREALPRTQAPRMGRIKMRPGIDNPYLRGDGLPRPIATPGARAVLTRQGEYQEDQDTSSENRPAESCQDTPAQRHLLPCCALPSVLIPDCK
jgi:hypothetical protein